MNNTEEIRGVVESQLADSEFVVDIVMKGVPGAQKLIVLVDSDNGMTIDGCARISRKISEYLEENDLFDSPYTLEVSSPGLDHPLKLKRQFLKNIGRGLKVRTVEGQEIEGILRDLKEDGLKIELSESKKEKSIHTIEIPITKIDKAMVLVSFNKQG